MKPIFDKARINFTKTTRISLDGISWDTEGDKLKVEITEDQREYCMLQLGIEIGKEYQKRNQKEKPDLKELKTKPLEFFKERFWTELNRYDENGKFVSQLTCYDENFENLYNSQFDTQENKYGQKFFYK